MGPFPRARAHLIRTLGFFGVPFREPFDAACGIDELFVAGKKRMTLGTDLDTDILFRRTGMDNLPTRAGDRRDLIGRMQIGFHGITSLITLRTSVLLNRLRGYLFMFCKNSLLVL